MRIAIAICAAFAAMAPSFAKEGNPIGGIGVSVETSPGGTMVQHNNAAEARSACIAAHGTFSEAAGKMKCANPGTPLAGAAYTTSKSNVKPPPNLAAPSSTPAPPH